MDTEEGKHVKHGECNHCHKYSGREEFNVWGHHYFFNKEERYNPYQTSTALHQMCLGKDGKGVGDCRDDGKIEANIGMEIKQ